MNVRPSPTPAPRYEGGAAAEADAIGKQIRTVETDAIESSSYRAAISSGAAAEADTIGGQQLSGAGLLTQANEGEVAERAKLLVTH